MLVHHRDWSVTLKGKCASGHFIQDDSKGVDITALITSIASSLFGRNVQWRPKLSSCQGSKRG
jgi:hypothetical protein